jgi:hypothetical protein
MEPDMRGIEFVIDDKGEKKAVLIDLKRHSGLWEDIYDALLDRERRDEPRESLDEVRRRLTAKSE